jgi:hypothetical protein
MTLSVTARFEMDCVINTSPTNWKDRVTRLMGAFVDTKPSATEGEHLRHERHPVQAAILIERRQDLSLGSDLHPVPYAEIQRFVSL